MNNQQAEMNAALQAGGRRFDSDYLHTRVQFSLDSFFISFIGITMHFYDSSYYFCEYNG